MTNLFIALSIFITVIVIIIYQFMARELSPVVVKNIPLPAFLYWFKSRRINDIFKHCLESGISKIIEDSRYQLTIKFKNDIIIKAWNSNKYYAWLIHGTIIKDGNILLDYNEERPSLKTMALLRKTIDQYYKDLIIQK